MPAIPTQTFMVLMDIAVTVARVVMVDMGDMGLMLILALVVPTMWVPDPDMAIPIPMDMVLVTRMDMEGLTPHQRLPRMTMIVNAIGVALAGAVHLPTLSTNTLYHHHQDHLVLIDDIRMRKSMDLYLLVKLLLFTRDRYDRLKHPL
jgi:hypothetical protein